MSKYESRRSQTERVLNRSSRLAPVRATIAVVSTDSGPVGSGGPSALDAAGLHEGDAAPEHVVIGYHERTKHHFNHFAASLGYMDWSTQPNPFRRYEGADLLRLPLPEAGRPLSYDELYLNDAVAPEPVSAESLSLFFRYALSLTAWKSFNQTTWPLRANPSSGNLHPTEGYAVLPPVDGLVDTASVCHYAPREHAFERRAVLDANVQRILFEQLPPGSFVVGLSSVHWREAWKYGERAFRYCQHDIGHALAALRIAAAAVGWRLTLLSGIASDDISRLLGLDRDEDFEGAEREEPELLAVVTSEQPMASYRPNFAAFDSGAVRWQGRANALSVEHGVEWPVIDEVAHATRRVGEASIAEDRAGLVSDGELAEASGSTAGVTAERVILGRRSAVALDGLTSISQTTFFRMLGRVMPTLDDRAMPWDAVTWRPRIHLGLFVHRVDGLAPGLYSLPRDPRRLPMVQEVMRPEFQWQRVPSCPLGLPLYLLQEGDCRRLAARISCGQDIAADGAFSLGMIADFTDSIAQYGAAFYRNLFWEAGMIGQVLYLEAEAAGIRATGIGCYFDDPVRDVFGITSHGWQSFYHFTVGGPVEDGRLTTLPAYGREDRR